MDKRPGESDQRAMDRLIDAACYAKMIDFVKDGHQVLIFVHSRNGTLELANAILNYAGQLVSPIAEEDLSPMIVYLGWAVATSV